MEDTIHLQVTANIGRGLISDNLFQRGLLWDEVQIYFEEVFP